MPLWPYASWTTYIVSGLVLRFLAQGTRLQGSNTVSISFIRTYKRALCRKNTARKGDVFVLFAFPANITFLHFWEFSNADQMQ